MNCSFAESITKDVPSSATRSLTGLGVAGEAEPRLLLESPGAAEPAQAPGQPQRCGQPRQSPGPAALGHFVPLRRARSPAQDGAGRARRGGRGAHGQLERPRRAVLAPPRPPFPPHPAKPRPRRTSAGASSPAAPQPRSGAEEGERGRGGSALRLRVLPARRSSAPRCRSSSRRAAPRHRRPDPTVPGASALRRGSDATSSARARARPRPLCAREARPHPRLGQGHAPHRRPRPRRETPPAGFGGSRWRTPVGSVPARSRGGHSPSGLQRQLQCRSCPPGRGRLRSRPGSTLSLRHCPPQPAERFKNISVIPRGFLCTRVLER